jgi:lysozyme family protein
MQADFAKALPRILVYEGGKVDNPGDPGGRTNQGVTQATFNAWLREQSQPSRDVYTITAAEVSTIYKTKYWDMVQGDKLPAGLDLCVFDAGVNSGNGQAGKWLQRALGDKFAAGVDGIIGIKTLQAVEDFGDIEALIGAFCSHRLATLQTLRTWGKFGKGWTARVANVLKTADSWAVDSPAPNPVDVTAAGGHHKAPISDQKVNPLDRVATHVTTTATAVGAGAASTASQLQPVQAAFPDFKYMGYVLGGLTVVSAFTGIAVKWIADARTAAASGSATAAVNLDADAGHPSVPVNDANPPTVTILPLQKAS